MSTKAQFTGTDSLRNYNNRYITTNPATAFTNNRLNTLLRGIIDFIDTARAGGGGAITLGIDTIYAVNDSIIRYRKNGVFRQFTLKGVYESRRKVDTAYAVNDTTLRITINGQVRNIILPGRGGSNTIAKSAQTADGNYIQDWNHKWLYFNNLNSLNFVSDDPDPNHPQNRKIFQMSADSTIDNYPFRILWGLKNINNDFTDSLHFELTSQDSSTYLYHWGEEGAKSAKLSLNGNSPTTEIRMDVTDDSKSSSLRFGHLTTIEPADSLRLKLQSTSATTKIIGARAESSGVWTPVVIDIPFGADSSIFATNYRVDTAKSNIRNQIAGKISALTNVGSGYAWATTPNGSIKKFNPTYGLTGDSSISNTISLKVDTSSTNHVVTQSDLNDAIAGAGGSIANAKVAYVDSAYGNNATGQVDRPDKPFLTINAALDATASLSKRIIQIGVGTFASPDSAKIKSYTWFRGSGKPKPNWTVAVPSIDGDTKTAPTKLVGGTILQGSCWFNSYRLQNIIISDLGVDVGSDWCTANNSGNPAEGLLFATAYAPGSGTAVDGGHFLQSGTTPCQGVVIRNVASLCQNATAAVHAALFENLFSPDISGVSTYFGTHGIVFKCIGGTASHLQAFGHNFNGIIIKSNDYANCYRFNLSNFTIGSIGSFDGGGLLLDANDAGSPGLYFCNITSGTINRTTYGIRTQGSVIDGNNISNISVNVAQGNGVDIQTGFAFGSLQNIKARTCGGHGFYVASSQDGITINDCDAHDNAGDGFRFTGVSNANFDNINAIYNDGYGVNVVSGSVNGGVAYYYANTSGATSGTIISKLSYSDLQSVTNLGATTTNAVSITGYSTTAPKFSIGNLHSQPYSLNNAFVTENSTFNGSGWTRPSTGYSSKLHYYNGQVMIANAASGSGAPSWIQAFKADYNGHVGLGGNIDDVTFSGSKMFVDGSSGNVMINTTTDNSSSAKLQVNGSITTVTDSAGSPKNMAWIDTDGKLRKAAVPSGGSSYTFTNGITESAGTVKLGGTQAENTTINSSVSGRNITYNGVSDFLDGPQFYVNNTGSSGIAIQGESTDGRGIQGIATSGVGIYGLATSGNGLIGLTNSGSAIFGQSDDGMLLEGVIQPSSTNTTATWASYTRKTTGTAANGLGATFDYYLQSSTGASRFAGNMGIDWEDATDATRASRIYWNNTFGTVLSLRGDGKIQHNGYGSGTQTVTPATTPVYSSSGVIGERIAPKIYTALLTQSGTGNPSATILGTNEIGSIVWTRNSTGNYTGTLTGAFTVNKTWAICQKGDMTGSFANGLLSSNSANSVLLTVTDNAGTLTDNFTNMSIEIRVYP